MENATYFKAKAGKIVDPFDIPDTEFTCPAHTSGCIDFVLKTPFSDMCTCLEVS